MDAETAKRVAQIAEDFLKGSGMIGEEVPTTLEAFDARDESRLTVTVSFPMPVVTTDGPVFRTRAYRRFEMDPRTFEIRRMTDALANEIAA